jgi:hypothetical protein
MGDFSGYLTKINYDDSVDTLTFFIAGGDAEGYAFIAPSESGRRIWVDMLLLAAERGVPVSAIFKTDVNIPNIKNLVTSLSLKLPE